MKAIDDQDVTTIRATHPQLGTCWYERVRQDRRIYYRLRVDERGGGGLTDAAHARKTIAYWRANGWIVTEPHHPGCPATLDPPGRCLCNEDRTGLRWSV